MPTYRDAETKSPLSDEALLQRYRASRNAGHNVTYLDWLRSEHRNGYIEFDS